MRAFLLRHILRILAPNSELAVTVSFPREWVVCHFCGEAGWGTHPHFGHPCPVVTQMAESAGMKLDADRSQMIRAGVHLEEMTRIARQHFDLEEEEGD